MPVLSIPQTIRANDRNLILGETNLEGFNGVRIVGTGFVFADNPLSVLPEPIAGTVTRIEIQVEGNVVYRITMLPTTDLPTLAAELLAFGTTPTWEQVFSLVQGATIQTYGPAILDGTDANDTFIGSLNDDFLNGGGGDDVLRGNAGDDQLFGDSYDPSGFGTAGHDILFGGDGDDYLSSLGGGDEMYGGAGNDYLSLENGGNARMIGGTGDDYITDNATGYGYEFGDVMSGGDGNDVISSNEGYDQLNGGDGDDRLYMNGFEGGRANGGAGDDTILSGYQGDFRLNGGAGNDYLSGEQGNDLILGGDGDDIIGISAGNDDIRGGAGADTFDFTRLEYVAQDGGTSVIRDFTIGEDLIATADIDAFILGLTDTSRSAIYTNEFGHTTLFRAVDAADLADWVAQSDLIIPVPIDPPDLA